MRSTRRRRRRLIPYRRSIRAVALLAFIAAAPGCKDLPGEPVAELNLEFIELVTGDADAHSALPMIVAMHGLGSTPESFAQLLEGLAVPTRIIVPRAPYEDGEGYSWFAMTGGADRASNLITATDELATFIEAMKRKRPTSGDPVVTGFSQGGMLSFALALRHPGLIHAAMPLSGMVPQALLEGAGYANTESPRILALHGGADSIFRADDVRRSIAALGGKGMDAQVRVYPGVGHHVTDRMKADLYGALADMTASAKAG